ncbi:MAG: hypothetical protein ACRD1L_09940 [Terriglobales bacterium]
MVGQAVLFANSRAFTFHGKSFPVGALALGRLEQCKAPGHAGKGGVLEIRMEGLQLSDGEVFPLDGAAVFHGGSRVIGVAGGALAAGFILAPYVAPAALILRGKAAVMPVGTTIIATLGAGGGGSSRTPEKQAVPGNTGKGPG